MRSNMLWKKTQKKLASVLALLLVLGLLGGCGRQEGNSGSDSGNASQNGSAGQEAVIPSDSIYGIMSQVEYGAILHCFSWSFAAIEESLEDIAMAGYSAIQTSPINACYDGGNGGMELYGQGKWYYHYQPTDWTIGNYQLGTREEFISLCQAADEYGIKVIVDVAPNHTTTTQEAISENFIEAVGGEDKLYHERGKNSIVDYTDRTQCTLGAVGGLYDVDTENPKFQDYFIAFLNDCIACGADGFRYDTAKHIGLADDPQEDKQENNFWDRVIHEVDRADELFVYGEVLQDGGERIADYIEAIGATTASAYGERIRAAVTTAVVRADLIENLRIGNAEPNVVTWVESHDNYTGDGTAKSLTNDQIRRAYAIIAARAVGTPLFFARPYGAQTDNVWGTFNKIGMVGDNLYKDATVVAANRFRNAMAGESERIFNPQDNERVVCIERGDKGLVIVNAGLEDVECKFETSLANGSYINHCDNTTEFKVKRGSLSAVLPAGSVTILYNEEPELKLETPALVKVADETRGYIIGDTLQVTLVAENAAKATYSVDGGAPVAYENGAVVTLGEGIPSSGVTRLTLTGDNGAGGGTSITYLFKKQEKVAEGTVVYFEKPEGWGDSISAYVYDETSYNNVKENGKWPGEAMKKEADGTYSYTFKEEWIAPLVIFTDGKNQSNGVLEPGEEIIAEKVYTAE